MTDTPPTPKQCHADAVKLLVEGDYAGSAALFDAARTGFREVANSDFEAKCNVGLADCYFRLEDFDGAEQAIRLALDHYVRDGAVKRAAWCGLVLGQVLAARKQYPEAVAVLLAARDGYVAQRDMSGIATTDLNLGDVHLAAGACDDAVLAYKVSGMVYRMRRQWGGVAESELGLGNAHFAAGNWVAAKTAYESADREFVRRGDLERSSACAARLREIARLSDEI